MLELSLFSNLSTMDLVFPNGTATAKGVNNIIRKLSLGQVDFKFEGGCKTVPLITSVNIDTYLL
jgi:hypothetical protein